MWNSTPQNCPETARIRGRCDGTIRCGIVRPMLLAGLFGSALFVALIVADWVLFTRVTAEASRYGYGVATIEDRLPLASPARVEERFGTDRVLSLPNGIARLFPEERRILLRPPYRLLAPGFRTAWAMKGSIKLNQEGEGIRLLCTKRIPWSSALLTLLWFLVVGAGTAVFAVTYLVNGGYASLSSLLLGLGVIGLGLLVLVFGLIIVSLAYRLENQRLMQAYQDLRAALTADLPQAR